jgi:hypothetical protein
LASDGSALIMMCGGMKNPNQMQQLVEKSFWLTHVARLWTHVVNNEK